MKIAPIGLAHVEELTAFAGQPEVVRFGEHLETDPALTWRAWMGDGDAHRRTTIGVWSGGELCCAARLAYGGGRRNHHVGQLQVIAAWSSGDEAIDAAVGALVGSADRWLQIDRIELVAPLAHPRVEGVYAAHGFVVETTTRGSIRRDGDYADEEGLARIRPGLKAPATLVGPPPPPARGEYPEDLTLRAVGPEDAAAWTRTLAEDPVIWGTLQLPFQRPERWAKRLRENDPNQILALGADVGGEIVASAVLIVNTTFRRRHVAGVAMHVSGAYQGRRVGRRLLEEQLSLATRLGLHRVELEVFPDNPRAVRLYESMGFAREGRRRFTAFREGALVDDLKMSRVG